MTTPTGAVPPGGRSSQQVYELATITPPAMANPDMFANAEGARGNFFGNALSGFLSLGAGLAALLEDIADALFRNYSGSNSDLIAIAEGQTAFNERVELLGDNGYCCMTLGSQVLIPSGRNRSVPFDTRIGPMNHATPVVRSRTHTGDNTARDEHLILLDRPGLWEAKLAMVQVQADWESFVEIIVLKPDLTPYTALSLPTPKGESNGTVGGNDFPSKGKPINMVKSFVVPTAGYYVGVRFHCVSGGAFHPRLRGGAQFAQFVVTQWSSDVAGLNAPENPTGEIVVT